MTKQEVIPSCPQCNIPMRCIGNFFGDVYTSKPPQWDDTYVCDSCKVQKRVKVHNKDTKYMVRPTLYAKRMVENYKDITFAT